MEGNTLMKLEEAFNSVHKAVLVLLRNGQSIENVKYLLRQELDKLEDAADYLEAMHDSGFRP
jgi:hypothetical protein